MVEKVSEVRMNVAMNSGSTQHDDALLKHIAKKKKQQQGDENSLLDAMLQPSALVRLATTLVRGGGVQKTEKQAGKEDLSASLHLEADSQYTKNGDGLRRQVALAVAGQMALLNKGNESASGQEGEATNAISRKGASAPQPLSATVPANAATNMLVDAVSKLQQSVTAQQSQTAALANPLIVNKSAKEAETGRQDKQSRAKDDLVEARPHWQGTKQAESVLPKQGETTAQSQNSPATLQQFKAQASGVKGRNEGQTLEVNFQFQRWSGDHSVKISVPTEARREGNVTLLPSDARAADVLQRNMGHLTGLNPDLLRPQQERDEQQQQRRQQQQQEEDQE